MAIKSKFPPLSSPVSDLGLQNGSIPGLTVTWGSLKGIFKSPFSRRDLNKLTRLKVSGLSGPL